MMPGSATVLETADTGEKHMSITEHAGQWQEGSGQQLSCV